MDDQDIVEHISQLAAEEQRLEEAHVGEGLSDDELKRKRDLEVALDQLWDVLRQRRAKRHAGQDPDAAQRALRRHRGGLSAVGAQVRWRRSVFGGIRRLSDGDSSPARPRRLPIVTSSQSNESRHTVIFPSASTTKRP